MMAVWLVSAVAGAVALAVFVPLYCALRPDLPRLLHGAILGAAAGASAGYLLVAGSLLGMVLPGSGAPGPAAYAGWMAGCALAGAYLALGVAAVRTGPRWRRQGAGLGLSLGLLTGLALVLAINLRIPGLTEYLPPAVSVLIGLVVLAFAAPTTNSYRRLVPGYEAPINLVYSQRNRSAAVRIPAYLQSEKAKRIEFRCPDPSCNGYLALPAILMAGLDGIQNKIDPGEPIDKNIYDLPPEEAKAIRGTPADLAEALAALEADHEFLLKGDVFTPDVIETWIAYKRKKEVDAIRLRPHPWEFHLYFDI